MILKKLLPVILALSLIFLFSCADNADIPPEESTGDEETDSIESTYETETSEPDSTAWNPEKLHELNVEYKTVADTHGETRLKMDIYYPTSIKYDKSPLIVAFHGGGWIAGDKSQIMYIFAPVVKKLRDSGYTVATVEYRYASDVIYFPAQIQDCTDAVLYLKNNAEKYNIDVNSIGVMGYSAGAHLAMLSAYAMDLFSVSGETADIKYCLSFAGPSKMYGDELNDYEKSTLYLIEYLFNGSYEEKEREYIEGSPYFYINGTENPKYVKYIPLFLAHDEEDTVVPFSQSDIMHTKAVEQGIPCELLKLNGVGHNIDFGSDYMISPTSGEAVEIILNFIYEHSGK